MTHLLDHLKHFIVIDYYFGMHITHLEAQLKSYHNQYPAIDLLVTSLFLFS